MKKLIIILLLSLTTFASKWTEQSIIDANTGTPAKVSADSALHTTMVDSPYVNIVDSAVVIVADTPAVKLMGEYTTDSLDFIRIDRATNSLQTITYEHHEIHAGSHFYVCDYSTVGSGDSIDFQLTTPNTTKWIHMTFQIEGTQEFTVEIFEGATVAADGAAITAYNNDRNSSNTTTLTLLQEGGTVSAPGTRIYGEQTGVAGNVNKARQGLSDRSREIILDQNSTYRFVITSGGADNNLSYCGEWYEHTNKH